MEDKQVKRGAKAMTPEFIIAMDKADSERVQALTLKEQGHYFGSVLGWEKPVSEAVMSRYRNGGYSHLVEVAEPGPVFGFEDEDPGQMIMITYEQLQNMLEIASKAERAKRKEARP